MEILGQTGIQQNRTTDLVARGLKGHGFGRGGAFLESHSQEIRFRAAVHPRLKNFTGANGHYQEWNLKYGQKTQPIYTHDGSNDVISANEVPFEASENNIYGSL